MFRPTRCFLEKILTTRRIDLSSFFFNIVFRRSSHKSNIPIIPKLRWSTYTFWNRFYEYTSTYAFCLIVLRSSSILYTWKSILNDFPVSRSFFLSWLDNVVLYRGCTCRTSFETLWRDWREVGILWYSISSRRILSGIDFASIRQLTRFVWSFCDLSSIPYTWKSILNDFPVSRSFFWSWLDNVVLYRVVLVGLLSKHCEEIDAKKESLWYSISSRSVRIIFPDNLETLCWNR